MLAQPFTELVFNTARLDLYSHLLGEGTALKPEHLIEESLSNIRSIRTRAVSSMQAIGRMVQVLAMFPEESNNYEAGSGEAIELLASLVQDLNEIESEIIAKR